jgi:hypothetical protein
MSTGKRVGDDSIIKIFFENYDYNKDPAYTKWEKQLYNEDNKFTFEKTLKFCGIDWKFEDLDWKKQTKQKWLKHIQEWNMIRYERDGIDPTEDSIVGYAAVTYIYVVLPYNSLPRNGERCEYITEFQAKLINIVMLHETGENLVCFKDYDMLTIDDPPHHPSAFEQFLDEQYNTASWFLTFLVCLRMTGHKGAIWS